MFIDTDDTVYLARYQKGDILRWVQDATTNISNADRIVSGRLAGFTTAAVSLENEIYFESASAAGQIEKRSVSGSTNMFVAQFGVSCYGLFIDMNNTLYCSAAHMRLVRSVSLTRNDSAVVTRAGSGAVGLGTDQLNRLWGIFVDVNFDLYVADANNNRIQRFLANDLNGTTVAGNGFPNGLHFAMPTDVIVDGDGRLYIADNNNHRVVRVSSVDYQCLVGCSRVAASAPDQLHKAYSLRFDSHGNLYIADESNLRVQKLALTSNCEGKSP